MRKISRMTLLDETVKSIKEYVTSGRLHVGDKMLTEIELCEMLGIGRSTVREALKMIQTMGYLEMRPGKGAFVLKITEVDEREQAVQWFVKNECEIKELLELRLFLEPYVARIAAERITAGEFATLEGVMEKFEKSYHDNDLISLTVCDRNFHTTIVGACHNNVFISIYNSLMQFLNEYFAMSFSIQETAKQSLEPHQRILEAIRRRDPILAKNEMRAHIDLTISNMLDVISLHKKAPVKQGDAYDHA